MTNINITGPFFTNQFPPTDGKSIRSPNPLRNSDSSLHLRPSRTSQRMIQETHQITPIQPMAPILTFSDFVFYLDLPKDDKTKKITQMLTLYGAKVLDVFQPALVTHVVVPRFVEKEWSETTNKEQMEIDNNNTEYKPMRRKRNATTDFINHSNPCSGIDLINTAKKLNKVVWSARTLVTKLNEMHQQRLEARKKYVFTQQGGKELNPTLNQSQPNLSSSSLRASSAGVPLSFLHRSSVHNNNNNSATPLTNSSSTSTLNNLYLHSNPLASQTTNPFALSSSIGSSTMHALTHALPYFNANLLVVEDITSANCRPLIKQFFPDKRNAIPKLHLENAHKFPLLSPFLSSEEAEVVWKKKEEREEKENLLHKDMRIAKKGGWCECCAVKYDDLEQHINTPSHQSFATNDVNYVDIDAFIRSIQ